MNRNVRVSVIILRGDELLVVRMQRKEKDIYVLAGGGLENGESLYEGSIREVKEETNLDVCIQKILYIKELYTETEEAMDIILLSELVGGELKKGYDPEHGDKQKLKEVKFVKLSELEHLNFHPKQLRKRLQTDFKTNFAGAAQHLGRFKYPEE